jgi:hypothetical protein
MSLHGMHIQLHIIEIAFFWWMMDNLVKQSQMGLTVGVDDYTVAHQCDHTQNQSLVNLRKYDIWIRSYHQGYLYVERLQ